MTTPGPFPIPVSGSSSRKTLPEGVKADLGKPPMHLLDPYALEEVSKVLAFGAAKYELHNWRKGIKLSRLLSAMLRHTFAFLRGEDIDKESGLPHMAHALCCGMFILWLHKERPDYDDRWKND